MRLKEIIDEDFVNYKKPSMFIGTISCCGKCCTEAGIPLSVCQNDGWRSCAPIDFPTDKLCERYVSNDITSAVVLGGLEPFEQFDEVIEFIRMLRNDYHCQDDVVIYTGYDIWEIQKEVMALKKIPNIVIKFGRYRPNQEGRDDPVLGVHLASNNQYGERIS